MLDSIFGLSGLASTETSSSLSSWSSFDDSGDRRRELDKDLSVTNGSNVPRYFDNSFLAILQGQSDSPRSGVVASANSRQAESSSYITTQSSPLKIKEYHQGKLYTISNAQLAVSSSARIASKDTSLPPTGSSSPALETRRTMSTTKRKQSNELRKVLFAHKLHNDTKGKLSVPKPGQSSSTEASMEGVEEGCLNNILGLDFSPSSSKVVVAECGELTRRKSDEDLEYMVEDAARNLLSTARRDLRTTIVRRVNKLTKIRSSGRVVGATKSKRLDLQRTKLLRKKEHLSSPTVSKVELFEFPDPSRSDSVVRHNN